MFCVSKNVMSINGLSFTSAKPTLQPCVSVHRCGVFEKWFDSLNMQLLTILFMASLTDCDTVLSGSGVEGSEASICSEIKQQY